MLTIFPHLWGVWEAGALPPIRGGKITAGGWTPRKLNRAMSVPIVKMKTYTASGNALSFLTHLRNPEMRPVTNASTTTTNMVRLGFSFKPMPYKSSRSPCRSEYRHGQPCSPNVTPKHPAGYRRFHRTEPNLYCPALDQRE